MITRIGYIAVVLSMGCFLNSLGADEVKPDAKAMEMRKVDEPRRTVDEPKRTDDCNVDTSRRAIDEHRRVDEPKKVETPKKVDEIKS